MRTGDRAPDTDGCFQPETAMAGLDGVRVPHVLTVSQYM